MIIFELHFNALATGLLDCSDAALQSNAECDSNQSALRYSNSEERGSQHNEIEAGNISADVPEVLSGPHESITYELTYKKLQFNI